MAGSSMIFYCNMAEGTELSLLDGQDIIEGTRSAVEKKLAEMGPVSGIINFHCILRTLQLKNEGRTQEYADVFRNFPMIGFSTYGEAYIGHINQTSTMLVFKKG
ncbi:MAG: FIST C-terminal domain-containing protein [Anaerolineaceae bacterium]|nr:FIST C-terminal domain-containing protein [Anaerolineaceae bacterium]